MAQTKTKRNGKDAPHCETCEMNGGKAYPHKETEKCYSRCSHCGINGHHMSLCYKLKFCQLCGKAGHNSYRYWTYSTIHKWILRAKVLHRCVDGLRPWKPHTVVDVAYHYCSYCGGKMQMTLLTFTTLDKPRNPKQQQKIPKFKKVKQSYNKEKLP